MPPRRSERIVGKQEVAPKPRWPDISTLQKLLIAPWLPALCAAVYVQEQWDRIPALIVVTFFQGSPTGWSSKSTALPLMLGLMFGLLAVITVILLMPQRIYERPPVAASLMGSHTAALSDEPSDRNKRLRLITVAQRAVGFLMPLSIWHVVSWNLRHEVTCAFRPERSFSDNVTSRPSSRPAGVDYFRSGP